MSSLNVRGLTWNEVNNLLNVNKNMYQVNVLVKFYALMDHRICYILSWLNTQ